MQLFIKDNRITRALGCAGLKVSNVLSKTQTENGVILLVNTKDKNDMPAGTYLVNQSETELR